MAVINEGVRVEQFFVHFSGDFKGRSFDSDRRPPIVLENSKSCAKFSDLISSISILQWVKAGVLSVWGEIGRVPPPYLVLPLTVESSKRRLCHDERYLNLWIKDLPFKLDNLSDLPRYVLPGHYQTSLDEKSGYQHVYLHPSSRTFFGLQWQGFYFTFCTLPFSWKARAFLYHNLGWQFLVQLVLLAFHILNISMIDTLVSFLYSRLSSPGSLATRMLRRWRIFFVICLWRLVILLIWINLNASRPRSLRFLALYVILFSKLSYFQRGKRSNIRNSGRAF